jgi:hypothetical protein
MYEWLTFEIKPPYPAMSGSLPSELGHLDTVVTCTNVFVFGAIVWIKSPYST